jgi:hypothetical protein
MAEEMMKPPAGARLQRALRAALKALLAPLIAVVGGMLIGAAIMLLAGHNPIQAYGAMIEGAVAGRNLSNLVSTISWCWGVRRRPSLPSIPRSLARWWCRWRCWRRP